jgi:hypothetical protein
MTISYDIDYGAVERHIRKRFASARILDEPFPHLQLDNVLPEEFYDLLLDALPLPQDLGSDNSGALNFGLHPDDPRFALMTPVRRQLWMDFENNINQRIIRSELLGLFSRYLLMKLESMLDPQWRERAQAMLGQDWQQQISSQEVYQDADESGGRMLLVTKDFGLAPHVDDPASLFTYLLYLPRDNKREEAGTRIHYVANKDELRAKYKANKKMGVWFPEAGDVTDKSFVFPFRRNSLAALICTPEAVHSAMLSNLNFCRYAIQTQVFLRDELGEALFAGWTKKGEGYAMLDEKKDVMQGENSKQSKKALRTFGATRLLSLWK